MNKLSAEAKERMKENIDIEIQQKELIYEMLSEEDRMALKIGTERLLQEKQNDNKLLSKIKRLFQKK